MFVCAKPVWPRGREKEVNVFAEFLTDIPAGAATVTLTASSAYQLFLDDTFVSYGPARAGEGRFRVDSFCVKNKKRLRVLVAGYYICSFEYSFNPSFLVMEVTDESGKVLFATGRDPIFCREYAPRLRFTDKTSRQRVFTENYDYTRAEGAEQELETLPEPVYLTRRTAYCENTVYAEVKPLTDMRVWKDPDAEPVSSPYSNRMLYYHPGHPRCFEHPDCDLYALLHGLAYEEKPLAPEKQKLTAGEARIVDYGVNRTGLVSYTIEADAESEVIVMFDELLMDGDVTLRRSNILNAIRYIVPAGKTETLSFEPYTFRYLKIIVLKGAVRLNTPKLIEIAGPVPEPVYFKDSELQTIYDAAVNTFRQNATDFFMDCPSRERAGWLCDSFFTSRTEFSLMGDNRVETSFLENFADNDNLRKAETCPEGMLPMLYPGANDYIGEWIANWALWGILEIGEYYEKRNGDESLREKLCGRVRGVLSAMKKYENADGLIEDMDGWTFVEWSRANDKDVVCGVNWPTNMLYSGALEAAGKLLGDVTLIKKAEKLKGLIFTGSWNGTYFTDNSVRENGVLTRTTNTTEVCQYYALFFGIADEKNCPALVDTVLHKFGPGRRQNNTCPDVPFANAFIGNYLRLEILMRMGKYEQVLSEIREYFGYMAKTTGTLWEYVSPQASCCHGFASYAAVWLKKLKEELNL